MRANVGWCAIKASNVVSPIAIAIVGRARDSNAANQAAQTRLIRAFNQRFAAEPRLVSTLFPAGDGMLIGVVL